MKRGLKFFILAFSLFLVMGFITLLEIFNFNIFNKIFTYIKEPASWFVGLSLAYAFSNLFQKRLFSLFSKKIIKKDENAESNFEIFLITLIITSLITQYVLKDLIFDFFTNFFIYFHIILLQSMIILYLFFKLKNDYEVSAKYFITSEIIALIYAIVILYFVV